MVCLAGSKVKIQHCHSNSSESLSVNGRVKNFQGVIIIKVSFYFFEVFHISVCWWFLTGVWMTARTLLSILADLSNTVVWMVSSCPLIFKSSSPFTKHLGIGSSVPTTIDITFTIMFLRFVFRSRASFRLLSLFSLAFNFPLWSIGRAKSLCSLFFLLTIAWSGRLSVRISKSHRVSFLWMDSRLCAI